MKFIVTFNMPDRMTAAEACKFIQTAVVDAGDRFQLLRSDVEVQETATAAAEALERVIARGRR